MDQPHDIEKTPKGLATWHGENPQNNKTRYALDSNPQGHRKQGDHCIAEEE